MNAKDLRIVFMGTPNISAYVLEGLIKEGYNIVGLIAQPNKPSGRRHLLISGPTVSVAKRYNIPTFQPEKIRKDYEFVNELKPDLILTLAYGQIVPQGLLDIPRLGALNLHGSLLPKYRGAAPIQYALLNNEKVTGMSLMRMVKEMDAGEVYDQEIVEIDSKDDCSSLFIKMGHAALKLILRDLPIIAENKLVGVPQNENEVTFAPSIKPEEEKIDLSFSKEKVYGLIRALSPTPGAYLYLDGLKIKIFESAIISNDTNDEVGKIIRADKGGLYVQLSNGVLSILSLQKEGKSRMDYKSFLNGNQNLLGKKFE